MRKKEEEITFDKFFKDKKSFRLWIISWLLGFLYLIISMTFLFISIRKDIPQIVIKNSIFKIDSFFMFIVFLFFFMGLYFLFKAILGKERMKNFITFYIKDNFLFTIIVFWIVLFLIVFLSEKLYDGISLFLFLFMPLIIGWMGYIIKKKFKFNAKILKISIYEFLLWVSIVLSIYIFNKFSLDFLNINDFFGGILMFLFNSFIIIIILFLFFYMKNLELYKVRNKL